MRDQIAMRFMQGSAQEQYRKSIFRGIIVLSSLIILLTSLQIQSIPRKLGDRIKTLLADRPWVYGLVVVDGRDIYLRGEVESNIGLQREIDLIAALPGVRSITNRVSEIPRPSAHFQLSATPASVRAGGQLSGDVLETLLSIINRQLAGRQFKDEIQIDDRMGQPVWLDSLPAILNYLSVLPQFEFNGWHDTVEISGPVENNHIMQNLGYGLPTVLFAPIRVINRLYRKPAEGRPYLRLRSDWSGLSLDARAINAAQYQSLKTVLTNTYPNVPLKAHSGISARASDDKSIEALLKFIPALASVQDLTLQSSDTGYIVWGRVDRPEQLGHILATRERLELKTFLRSLIEITPAAKSATLSLFSDGALAVVNGVLPNHKVKMELMTDIRTRLNVEKIIDLVSIEPGVSHDRWLNDWQPLLDALAGIAVGVTIHNDAVLISGNAEDHTAIGRIDAYLDTVFAEKTAINWMTVGNRRL